MLIKVPGTLAEQQSVKVLVNWRHGGSQFRGTFLDDVSAFRWTKEGDDPSALKWVNRWRESWMIRFDYTPTQPGSGALTLGTPGRRAVYAAPSSRLQPPADVPDFPGLSASFSPTPDVDNQQDNQQDWHVSPQMCWEFQKHLPALWLKSGPFWHIALVDWLTFRC